MTIEFNRFLLIIIIVIKIADAGFNSASQASQVSVFLGFFKLVMTGVAVLFVDSTGRRPLLLSGISVMIVSLIILGATAATSIQNSAIISVVGLLCYVGAYQVSFGPISWLIVGEIFPLGQKKK